ncbi:MAG: hypothetical protein HOQ05_04150 [Corynebacteriales bacterium]|nr:hypothetical protein [Mycobacteriales bacterium]
MTPEQQHTNFGTLLAEKRAAEDPSMLLANYWHRLNEKIADKEAQYSRQLIDDIELAVLVEQREWLGLFLATDQHGQVIANPHIPIAHAFIDEQCPIITCAWGPAAPSSAVFLLVNELPRDHEALYELLNNIATFIEIGPPGCAAVALFSSISKLGTKRFDSADGFTIIDPATALRTSLDVHHIRTARRVAAARIALPTAIVGVGGGDLVPRTVLDFFKKREFFRRPAPHTDVRTFLSAPSSHLDLALWRRLSAFTTRVERQEVLRVESLLRDYANKQQFWQQLDPATANEYAQRTVRELRFNLGWNSAVIDSIFTYGVPAVQNLFTTWRESIADRRTAAQKEEATVLATRPRPAIKRAAGRPSTPGDKKS